MKLTYDEFDELCDALDRSGLHGKWGKEYYSLTKETDIVDHMLDFMKRNRIRTTSLSFKEKIAGKSAILDAVKKLASS